MKHCNNCGTEYTNIVWPRKCTACGLEVWRRINPVAVLIQPVLVWDNDEHRIGIIIGKRGIPPSLGVYGLPGGFVEFDEQPELGAVREIKEEMGFDIDPATITYSHSYTDDKGHLLLFFRGMVTDLKTLGEFVPSIECTEMDIAFEPMPLAFDSHTIALARYF